MTGSERIELRSDNAAGVALPILEAVGAANVGSALAYGADDWTTRLGERVVEVFEHSGARVFPVVSGTAANAVGLSAMLPPWGAVLCHETAHILRSEAAATSLLAGGALLRGLPGPGSKLTVPGLEAEFAQTWWDDPHVSQPRVLSVTSPTDRGAVYSLAEMAELAAAARARGLRVHLDGARLANAVVGLGCTPAEATWRAGVDVLSLGATKNGALSTDAIVSFDDEVSEELRYRTKRSGHVASKMRFQSAQLERYLTDDLWLRLARNANRTMTRLYAGLVELGYVASIPPQANLVFIDLDPRVSDRLAAAGVDFYRMAGSTVRFVTSFATTDAEIDRVLAVLASC